MCSITECTIVQLHSHHKEFERPILVLYALPSHLVLRRASSLYTKVVVYENDIHRATFYRALIAGTWTPLNTSDKLDRRWIGFNGIAIETTPKPSATTLALHHVSEGAKWIKCAAECLNIEVWHNPGGIYQHESKLVDSDLKQSIVLIASSSDATKDVRIDSDTRPVCVCRPDEDATPVGEMKLNSLSLSTIKKIIRKSSRTDGTSSLYISTKWINRIRPLQSTASLVPLFPGPHNGKVSTTTTTKCMRQTSLVFAPDTVKRAERKEKK